MTRDSKQKAEKFVYVCPSVWRDIDVRTMTAIMAALVDQRPPGWGVYWEPLWNDALLARSRSLLATKFLEDPAKAKADVLVIIDSDIVFDPEDFWKIVEGAEETRSIYGAGYVVRSKDAHLSSRTLPGATLNFRKSPVRNPIEIEYLATGFWAVHRDVLEQMVSPETRFEDADGGHQIHRVTKGASEPFWPVFATFTVKDREGNFHYLSEDWAFCEQARQMGFKVWMDQSIILAHMGWYPFTVADIARPEVTETPSQGGTDLVEIPAAEGPEDELLATLVEDIAAFTEDDEGNIRRILTLATGKLFDLWQTRTEKEGNWYRREDVGIHYLADLANWHLAGFGVPLEMAAEIEGRRVVDFGGGIGTWALAAARAGAEVTVVETNPVLRNFIKFRSERRGYEVEVRSRYEGIPVESLDVVTAWHVFEHLENPEAVLDDLVRRLRPGGVLISESGFGDASTPMHHVRDDWEEVLEARGLVREGEDPLYRMAEMAVAVAV